MKNITREVKKIAKNTGLKLRYKAFTGKKLTHKRVVKALNRLKVKSDDVVIFYYSGHGHREKATKTIVFGGLKQKPQYILAKPGVVNPVENNVTNIEQFHNDDIIEQITDFDQLDNGDSADDNQYDDCEALTDLVKSVADAAQIVEDKGKLEKKSELYNDLKAALSFLRDMSDDKGHLEFGNRLEATLNALGRRKWSHVDDGLGEILATLEPVVFECKGPPDND